MTTHDDVRADIKAAMAHWDAIYGELNGTPDRVAAIAALAHVEALLKDAICSRFADLSNNDKLFGPGGALIDVGARLDLAFALGIISRQTMRDVKTCARIRNLFAHSFQPIKFSDEPVVELIAKLATPKIKSKSPWGVGDERAKYLTTLWSARSRVDFALWREGV